MKEIERNSIKIIRTKQHPYFIDHSRKIVISQGVIRTERTLYPDSGDGCNAYLFDTDTGFILIDCNAQWFSINKITGRIDDAGWRWQEILPDKYLGTFKREDHRKGYLFLREQKITLAEVYKYKDPDM